MNCLRALRVFGCSAVIFLFPYSYVQADEDSEKMIFVAGVNLDYQTVKFKIFTSDFEPEFTMVGISFAAAYQNFYASIDYNESIKDFVKFEDTYVQSFSREDYSFTAGYNFWKDFTLFGGYKSGETRILVYGDSDGGSNQDLSLHDSGPFLGLGYAISFRDKGSLGFNVAYAAMKGEFKFREYEVAGVDKGGTKGDTTGYSYGVTWSGELAGSLTYRIGLKVNQYRFEDKDIAFDGNDLSFDEKFTIFTLGVANYF